MLIRTDSKRILGIETHQSRKIPPAEFLITEKTIQLIKQFRACRWFQLILFTLMKKVKFEQIKFKNSLK